jgi:hypothetical protein
MKYIPTELKTLLKSCNTLVQIVTLYLFATWGWELIQFLKNTILGAFI